MAELTRLHPLEEIGAELAARSNPSVTITAEPYVAMVDVRLPTRMAVPTLPDLQLPGTPNTWLATGSGHVVWLAPGEWLLTSTTHTPDELADQVRATVQPLGGAAVDVSAQRIGIRVAGTRAREVLAKGCSIDLHPTVFISGSAAQTTVGLAGVILLSQSNTGDDSLLLVRSSFARYLADWLLDASQEFSTQEFTAAEFTDPATDLISSQE